MRLLLKATVASAAMASAAAFGAGSAAAAVTDTPGAPPALMSTCSYGPLVTEPGEVVLTCGDGNVYVTGITWAVWSATHALGVGQEHVDLCQPDCADGRSEVRPAVISLDQPLPAPGGRARFSHADVYTLAGHDSFRP